MLIVNIAKSKGEKYFITKSVLVYSLAIR